MDEEMRRQMKLQAQIHADHLREVLVTKERETERLIKRALSEKKEEESCNTKAQLASVIGKLRGLDDALKREYLEIHERSLGEFVTWKTV